MTKEELIEEENAKTHAKIEEIKKGEFFLNVKKLCKSFGYDLKICWKDWFNDLAFRASSVDEYFPEINVYEGKFRMQTFSCGTIDGEKLDRYVNGINSAHQLIRILECYDWTVCPSIMQ